YTGLINQNGYWAAFPLIVRVDDKSGECLLSAPLPKDVKAGILKLAELKFQPFAGTQFAGGKANPAAMETLNGWKDYVRAVCRTAKQGLGTEGAADAGFDLEVWNEYTFGSNFLNINRYYDPDLKFSEPLTYTSRHGETKKGAEAILLLTVDWVTDPRNHCPNVRVISGFANQRPWDSLSRRWLGQAGISRHYYSSTDNEKIRQAKIRTRNRAPLDALGRMEGERVKGGWNSVREGSFFIPAVDDFGAFPEKHYYGWKTEFMARDVQPFPSTDYGPQSFAHHHRYGHPGNWCIGEVWRTETNVCRGPFARRLMEQYHCEKDDPRLIRLLHQLAARWVLRLFLFAAHKGESTITLFRDGPDDTNFGFLPSTYFTALEQSGGRLTAQLRQLAGPQFEAIARVTKQFRSSSPEIDVARKVAVTRITAIAPKR
ncbi:hypothetical protein D6833_06170, partial [Candidatus Parcubacteria bacterium]